jgi:endo-1,4-beta-mannosidase
MEEPTKRKAKIRKFRLGLNYWPANKAMYWWKLFQLSEVKADFYRISQAGFDSVRIFLLWEDFQPSLKKISKQSLKNLIKVAEVASENQLQLIITFFTGHMSGINWLPKWAILETNEKQRFRVFSNGKVLPLAKAKNWYDDPEIIKAQEKLVLEVVSALKQNEAIWAWDLGNENSNCVVPTSKQKAIRWLEKMTNAIRKLDRKPITIGLHMEDLEENRILSPKEAAQFCDFLCMHGYPIYAKWARYPTDAFLLPFLGLITKWLSNNKSEVLFEEFGLPTMHNFQNVTITEEEAAEFIDKALQLLYQFKFIGAMLWCYSDYSSKLWNKPPFDEATHERYFGLWKVSEDNQQTSEKSKERRFLNSQENSLIEKQALERIKEFAKLIDNPKHKSKFQDFMNFDDWIDISTEEFYLNPSKHLQRLYEKFIEKISETIRN